MIVGPYRYNCGLICCELKVREIVVPLCRDTSILIHTKTILLGCYFLYILPMRSDEKFKLQLSFTFIESRVLTKSKEMKLSFYMGGPITSFPNQFIVVN